MLGCSVATVERAVKLGQLRAVRVSARKTRFLPEDVDTYIASFQEHTAVVTALTA